jgi:hypothetical protein
VQEAAAGGIIAFFLGFDSGWVNWVASQRCGLTFSKLADAMVVGMVGRANDECMADLPPERANVGRLAETRFVSQQPRIAPQTSSVSPGEKLRLLVAQPPFLGRSPPGRATGLVRRGGGHGQS